MTIARLTVAALSLLLLAAPARSQDSDQPQDKQPGINSELVSALRFRNIGPAFMSGLAVEFQPTVPLPEVAEAMVAMELHFERLEQLAANDWKPLSHSPELKPGHEALLLREQFTELLRTETIQAESADYREQLRSGEQLAAQLEELLRGEPKDPAGKEASRGLGALKANCTACHRRFRDQPGAVRGGNRESR